MPTMMSLTSPQSKTGIPLHPEISDAFVVHVGTCSSPSSAGTSVHLILCGEEGIVADSGHCSRWMWPYHFGLAVSGWGFVWTYICSSYATDLWMVPLGVTRALAQPGSCQLLPLLPTFPSSTYPHFHSPRLSNASYQSVIKLSHDGVNRSPACKLQTPLGSRLCRFLRILLFVDTPSRRCQKDQTFRTDHP